MPTLETRMDDIRAVMDDAGAAGGGALERTAGNADHDPVRGDVPGTHSRSHPARSGRARPPSTRLPLGAGRERMDGTPDDVRAHWGKSRGFPAALEERAPDAADDPAFHEWFVTHMRRSLSPGAAAGFFRMVMDADISDVLPAVRVPTVVLFSPAERGPAEYVASRIPNARMYELPAMGGDFTWMDDATHERRWARQGVRARCSARASPIVYCRRCCSPTSLVRPRSRPHSVTGDGRTWCGAITRSCAIGRVVPRHRARHCRRRVLCGSTGRPERWRARWRCARGPVLGIEVRAGVHTGECEVVDDKCAGLSVSIGARVASHAGTGGSSCPRP